MAEFRFSGFVREAAFKSNEIETEGLVGRREVDWLCHLANDGESHVCSGQFT